MDLLKRGYTYTGISHRDPVTWESSRTELYRNWDLQCHEDLLTRGSSDTGTHTRGYCYTILLTRGSNNFGVYLHGDLLALGSTYTGIYLLWDLLTRGSICLGVY